MSAYLEMYLRIGYSGGPAGPAAWVWREEDLAFRIDGSRQRLYYKYPSASDMLMVTLKSEAELEFEDKRREAPYRLLDRPVRLRKQAVD